jgi:hypothetical protein
MKYFEKTGVYPLYLKRFANVASSKVNKLQKQQKKYHKYFTTYLKKGNK